MHYYHLITVAYHAACDAACRYQRVQGHQMHAEWHKAARDFGKAGAAGVLEICAVIFAAVLLYRAHRRRAG